MINFYKSKMMLVFALFLMMPFHGIKAQAQKPSQQAEVIMATTEDGKKVILFSDGTWKFVKGADIIPKGAIHQALLQGDLDRVKSLLEKNPNLFNDKNDINIFDPYYGSLPLHIAAAKGYIEIADLLLSKGAKINDRQPNGNTPLHLAIENNKKEMSQFLISKGADVNAKDNEENTPLKLAVNEGFLDEVKLLLENGANVNAKTASGFTPLDGAILRGVSLDVVKLLLAKGSNVNTRDSTTGYTPLHRAVSDGNVELVHLLLENGANVNAKTEDGYTPLDFANLHSSSTINYDMSNILQKYGGVRGHN